MYIFFALFGYVGTPTSLAAMPLALGARVVGDRYCYGAAEARQPIEIREGETPLRAIARHYLLTSQCTRFMEQNEMRRRFPDHPQLKMYIP